MRVEPRAFRYVAKQLIVAAGIVASSCSPQARPLTLQTAPAFEAGFKVFPSPRTFDPPGTIIRVDPEGVRHPVVDLSAMLNIVPREEAIPKISVYGEIDVGAFFSWLGNSAGNLGFDRIDSAVVEVVGARREQAFEVDLNRLVDSAKLLLDWRKPGRFFLIKETVLADSVVMTLSRSLRIAVGNTVKGDSTAKHGVSISWSPRAATRLGLKFRNPHRIFYKVELLARGARLENDTSTAILRIPVSGAILWRAESREY